MGYYSRHSIFLKDNDRQKLELIQKLLEEEDSAFDIREETVYLYDGESITVPCVSDENWNSGLGYKWYDFASLSGKTLQRKRKRLQPLRSLLRKRTLKSLKRKRRRLQLLLRLL